jgi:hypothetical protein
MKSKQKDKGKGATCGPTRPSWEEMNRKQRREMMRKIQSEELRLEVVHPDAAGIDIGNESHYVAVPPSRDSQPVGPFGCTTAELKVMADWLKQCEIRTIAMQSTGVYWIAVFPLGRVGRDMIDSGAMTGNKKKASHSEQDSSCAVGDRVKVNLHTGSMVDATVKAVIDHTDGKRLQLDFGKDKTALVHLWQVVERVR